MRAARDQPPRSLDARESDTIAWQLLDTLFDQRLAIIIGWLVVGFCAVAILFGAHQTWSAAWLAVLTLAAGGRLLLERAYRWRAASTPVTVWSRRFEAGTWGLGAAWGCGACVILADIPLDYKLLFVSVLMVTIMAAVARNAGSLRACRGQALVALVPLFLACAFGPDVHGRLFCIPVVALLAAALGQAKTINAQTLRLLRVNEENLNLVREIERANMELAAMATTDALTGISNRRRFDAVLSDELRRAQREGSQLTLILLDIDSFKRYNDLYGHQAGDAALVGVAQMVAQTMRRPADEVARYGGEEFVAVLPRTDAANGRLLAERAREAVAALGIVNAAGQGGRVTVSLGVVSGVPAAHHRPEDFIRAADQALYAAKGAGRNRVRVASQLLLELNADHVPEGALS